MRMVLVMAIMSATAATASAAVKSKPLDYQHGGVTLKGHLYWDDATAEKRPGILVVHEWWGLNDYAKKRASMLAELGYAALAVDMYGNGQVADHPDKAGEMATKVRTNLATWEGRAIAAVKTLQAQPMVDGAKIGAIGYCFGGSTAIQLALAGADVKAVASFHGSLPAVTPEQAKAVKAKILVCHGAEDTFIPEDVCQKFRAALSTAGADYEFAYFGGAKHSFTVKEADSRGVPGLKYNAEADRRSWAMMQQLFKETFGR